MKYIRVLAAKVFTKGSKKVIDATSGAIEKNPEIVSVALFLSKKFERYFSLGKGFLHFHFVWFFIAIGLGLMSTTIAFGKFLISMEINYFVSNRDLIFNFAYASFFISIIFGFICHYKSQHHKIYIKKEKIKLENKFKQKNEELERKYNERMHQLETRFLEEEEKFLAMQRDNEAKQSDNTLWDSLPSIGVKRKKAEPSNDLSNADVKLLNNIDDKKSVTPKNKKSAFSRFRKR